MHMQAIEKVAIANLRRLRESNPVQPMVTTLDMTAEDLENAPGLPVPPPEDAAGPSDAARPSGLECPGCRVRDEANRKLRNHICMLKLYINNMKKNRKGKGQKPRDPIVDLDVDTPGFGKYVFKCFFPLQLSRD